MLRLCFQLDCAALSSVSSAVFCSPAQPFCNVTFCARPPTCLLCCMPPDDPLGTTVTRPDLPALPLPCRSTCLKTWRAWWASIRRPPRPAGLCIFLQKSAFRAFPRQLVKSVCM